MQKISQLLEQMNNNEDYSLSTHMQDASNVILADDLICNFWSAYGGFEKELQEKKNNIKLWTVG